MAGVVAAVAGRVMTGWLALPLGVSPFLGRAAGWVVPGTGRAVACGVGPLREISNGAAAAAASSVSEPAKASRWTRQKLLGVAAAQARY